MQSRDKEQASSRGVNEILQVEAIVRYKWVAISVRGGGTREGYSGPVSVTGEYVMYMNAIPCPLVEDFLRLNLFKQLC